MKNIIFVLVTLYSISAVSQTIAPPPAPTNIVEVCSPEVAWGDDVPDYTYFKDINNTFGKFIGTWKFEHNNHIVIFKIIKITQKYDPEFKAYEDYLLGNYSYSTDGGANYIVNTFETSVENDVESYPMYSSCAETNKISFIFTDVLLNKKSCWIFFEFLPNSITQMKVSIKNPEKNIGLITNEGGIYKNIAFTLPVIMTVTKQ
ncbi:MAG: DUF6705 family protein [Bacteroidota bacterium]